MGQKSLKFAADFMRISLNLSWQHCAPCSSTVKSKPLYNIIEGPIQKNAVEVNTSHRRNTWPNRQTVTPRTVNN